MGSHLFRQIGGSWGAAESEGYVREQQLQEILAAHPAIIPGMSDDAVVLREVQSDSGPADLVAVDPRGNVTLVECKLQRNPQARREVLSQVLDYAAALWEMSVAELDARWRTAGGQSLATVVDSDDWPVMRESLQANLVAGRFTVVLAMDRVSSRLERLVDYVNTVTTRELTIYLSEYAYYGHGGVEVLVPKHFGIHAPTAAQAREAASRERASIDDFLHKARTVDPAGYEKLLVLVDQLKHFGFNIEGTRAATLAFAAGLRVRDTGRRWPITVRFESGSDVLIQLRFSDYKRTPELAEDLLERLAPIVALKLDEADIRDQGYGRKPTRALSTLSDADIEAIVAMISEWAAGGALELHS